MKKNRILWLDILKIIACFLVVVNHTGSYVLDDNYNNITVIFYCLNFAICKMAVPIFLMVTGSLLLKKQFEYKYILKKIVRILIPLIAISFVLYYKANGLNALAFAKSFLEEPIVYPYWYLYMLISLYLITPLIQKMLKNFCDKDYIYLFTICLIIPSILSVITSLLNINISSWLFICLFPKTIGIYILGYYLSNCKIDKKIKNIFWILLITLISLFFITMYLPYAKGGEISYIFDGFDTLFAIGEAAALFYIFRYYFANKRIGEKCSNVIGTISECTFGIYLFHYLVIYRIYHISIIQEIFKFNRYIGVVLLEIAAFILCGIVTYILKKIPYVKKCL